MKKVLLWIFIPLIIIGIAVGGFFGIRALVDNNKKAGDIKVETQYLQDEYVANDTMVFKFTMQADKAITSVKYTIDNGEEVYLTGKSGEVKDNDDFDAKDGDYFYDTGVVTLALTDMRAGTHIMTVYAYQDTTRVEACTHIFRVADAN